MAAEGSGSSGPVRPAPILATVAWQGRIENARALARALGLAPGASTDAVLLAAWHRWGPEMPAHLSGVFSLALRDGDEWLLYRDPSGLRSLFHGAGGPGTGPQALELGAWPADGSRGRLLRRSLHEYLRFGDIAAPHTVYEGIAAVEPGQALHGSSRGLARHGWPVASASGQPGPLQAATDSLETRLRRSLRAALEPARRPAAFLSGGVDSALLCALAAQIRPDLTAVTVAFEGQAHDEAPAAARVAAHLGLKHEVLRFDRAALLGAFERVGRQAEQPIADPATAATVLAFEHCRERYDSVLDGTGADEAVGMMPPRHVRWAVGGASRLPLAVRRVLAAGLRLAPGLAGYAPIVDFEHPADTMIRWRGFTRGEIERLAGEPVSFADTRFYRVFEQYPRGAHFQRYSALVDAMPCERLNQAMRISGLQPHYPFCDAEVDRHLRGLHPALRYAPGAPKRVLRALLARHVPPPLWEGPKHGFDFPWADFLAGDDGLLMRRHLDPGSGALNGILDPALVQHYVRRFRAGERDTGFRVWLLVVLAAWLRAHPPASEPPAPSPPRVPTSAPA
ncbi:MAG: 7-cyano-7-deazaguanine synthase [Burkholderiales bacterium]|nr:7-cyano-7-deazaguanine synthase [Burkholderiales bacterium]